MLMNNLDPEVAERPEDLVVYGGTGRAARNWECFDAIVASSAPRGRRDAPRPVRQAGRRLPHHADAPARAHRQLEPRPALGHLGALPRARAQGLMMYGQMTAGSWIYIGTQGILQGTYETFAEAARQHFGGTPGRAAVVTAGLGGMGGAQPLAVTMNGGSASSSRWTARARRRLDARYLDELTDDLDDAVATVTAGAAADRRSVGLSATRPTCFPNSSAAAGPRPRHRPDQRPRPAQRLRPERPATGRGARAARSDPDDYVRRAQAHGRARPRDARLPGATGRCVRLRQQHPRTAQEAGVDNAFDFPGFVPAYIRPLFCEGKGPFLVAALSGDPADIAATDGALPRLPRRRGASALDALAAERVPFQGLPARICWLGYGDAREPGSFNELVATGAVTAPIVIGRDHLDAGSVASPNRETEAMRDGSDAVADWPILNALVNTVAGATWVCFHHGGGVGIGYSLHAGMVVVADGTAEAAARLERVLTTDPGMGVLRHADAGYERAIEVAASAALRIPMRPDA